MNIEPITFDITGTPLTTEELTQQRESASTIKQQCDRREKTFKRACFAIGISAFAILMIIWYLGHLPGEDAVLAGLGLGTFAFLLTGNAVLSGPLAVAGIAVLGGGAVVAIFTGAVLSAIVMGVANLYERNVVEARNAADRLLSALCELNAQEYPEECAQFVHLCEQDKTIRSFQNVLCSAGRRPVLGEFLAAKEWIESTEKRQSLKEKEARARVACEKLSLPI